MQISFGPIFLLAAIVLCVLKSAGVLSISWTVALMPIWIPLAIVLALFVVMLLVAGVIFFITGKTPRPYARFNFRGRK